MAIRAPLEIPAEDGPDRDRALVQAHVQGDPSAFQQLVLGHYQSMLGHAYRRLHDGQAAEDAVQDALVRAYRSLSPAHEDYRLGPWLHRILDNVCTDEATRRAREFDAARRFQSDLVVLRPVEDDSPDLEYVNRAIAALPPGYREALVMRDVMDLEYADMAEQSGITEQNARARVSRARAALRKIVASSVGVWVILGRGFRRGTIGTPKLIRDLSTSASTMPPETVANTSRSISAASTIALTAVAVASVAAPALVPGAPTTPAPSSNQAGTPVKAGAASGGQLATVSANGPATGAYTLAAPPVLDSVAPLATSTTADTTTTSITTPKPRAKLPSSTATVAPTSDGPAYPAWTGASVPAPAGAPIPNGDVTAPDLHVVPGSGSDTATGQAAVGWASSGANGPFTGSFATPESACGSAIQGTVNMTGAGGRTWTLHFAGELTAAWSDQTGQRWGFVGQATATGSPDYSGSGWIQGTIRFTNSTTMELLGNLWGQGAGAAPKGPGACSSAPTSSNTTSTTSTSVSPNGGQAAA